MQIFSLDLPFDWPLILAALLFMALDVVSGFFKGIVQKNVSSGIMREGFAKKLSLVLVLFLAQFLQWVVPLLSLDVEIPAVAVVVTCIILMEAVSVLENVAQINPSLQRSRLFRIFDGIIDGYGVADDEGDVRKGYAE